MKRDNNKENTCAFYSLSIDLLSFIMNIILTELLYKINNSFDYNSKSIVLYKYKVESLFITNKIFYDNLMKTKEGIMLLMIRFRELNYCYTNSIFYNIILVKKYFFDNKKRRLLLNTKKFYDLMIDSNLLTLSLIYKNWKIHKKEYSHYEQLRYYSDENDYPFNAYNECSCIECIIKIK